jgi:BlaI family penicillinase repressor
MAKTDDQDLSRRERQIMDVIYARGQASALEVTFALPDPPTKTAVRTILRILEDKGQLTHKLVGQTYVFKPCRPRESAGPSALKHVLNVFFAGSFEQAVAAHLGQSAEELSDAELKRVIDLIQKARKNLKNQES